MAGFFKEAEHAPAPPSRRVETLIIFLLLVLWALFIEHWRGERALRTWRNDVTAHGEILDPNKLWPAPVPSSRELSNHLAEAVRSLPKSLTKFAGRLSGLSQDELGRPSRGSKQARPPLS